MVNINCKMLKVKPCDFISLVCALFAFILHMIGMILPNWWIVDDFDKDGVKVDYYYGIWMTKACANETCFKEIASMEGDRAWLIGAVVLVLLAAIFLLSVLAINVLYTCRPGYGAALRKLCVLLSGGAGAITSIAVVIFVKKKSGLIPSKATETSDGNPGWTMYVTIVAAILSAINAVIIAVGVSRNFRKGIQREFSMPELIVKQDSYYEKLQQMLVDGHVTSATAEYMIKMAPEKTSKPTEKRRGSEKCDDVKFYMPM